MSDNHICSQRWSEEPLCCAPKLPLLGAMDWPAHQTVKFSLEHRVWKNENPQNNRWRWADWRRAVSWWACEPKGELVDGLCKIHRQKVHLCFINSIIINSIEPTVFPQQIEEVRRLCEQCGVDNKGSKMDVVIRLWKKMSNRVIYSKLFEKVWGASGKWNNNVVKRDFT